VTNELCEPPFVAHGAAIAEYEGRTPAPVLEALKRKELEEAKNARERTPAPEEKLRLEKARLEELQRLKQTDRPSETERLSRGKK